MGPDEKPNQSVRKVKANHGLGFKPLVLFHSQYLFQISLNLQDDSTKAAIINQIEKKKTSIHDPCFLRWFNYFYPWFKFYFLLFQTHYHVINHTLQYPKQKKIKFEPRIKLNHNIYVRLNIPSHPQTLKKKQVFWTWELGIEVSMFWACKELFWKSDDTIILDSAFPWSA